MLNLFDSILNKHITELFNKYYYNMVFKWVFLLCLLFVTIKRLRHARQYCDCHFVAS